MIGSPHAPLRRAALLTLFAVLSGCQSVPAQPQGEDAPPVATALPVPAAVEAGDFGGWLAAFEAEALASGVSRATLGQALRGLTFNPRVIELDNRQPEFVRPVWDYLGRSVSGERIARGRQQRSANAAALRDIEGRYGVPAEVLVAIWGMETNYGGYLGDNDVIESLASLAYAGRRQAFWRGELLSVLRLVDAGDVARERLRGSWAGAMGHTQFMPSTYTQYAVDYDGDGRRDLWGQPLDALASAANYLASVGWRAGVPWGWEVRLPSGFDWVSADPERRRSAAEWAAMGVRAADGAPLPQAGGELALLTPAGAGGAAFLVTANFRAILRYNNSTSYALAVGHLADRIGGAGPLRGGWPDWQRALSRDERVELQQRLASGGHDPGPADGILGAQTRAAVRRFQLAHGLTADGYPSSDVLAELRRRLP